MKISLAERLIRADASAGLARAGRTRPHHLRSISLAASFYAVAVLPFAAAVALLFPNPTPRQVFALIVFAVGHTIGSRIYRSARLRFPNG